jgi:hypothetical protein
LILFAPVLWGRPPPLPGIVTPMASKRDGRRKEPGPFARRFHDRFDLLFVVTIATVGLLLLVDINQQEGITETLAIIVTILTSATLLLAVAAAGVGKRALDLAWIAAGSTVIASIIAAFLPTNNLTAGGGLLWLLLVITAPIVALKRLIHHEKVTVETVLGAVSVFLLMAVAGTYLFLFIDGVWGPGGRFFGQEEPTTVFMYFSLVTITTLGYGDFSPVDVAGRAASAWIAVTGQIYLVVVVARMVAVFSGERANKKRSDDPGGD